MTAVRAARASILLMLVLVLSGCGLAGNGFQPGVAVLVEDRTISQRHVTEVTSDYCSALVALKQVGGGVSLRHLSTQFVVPILSIRLAVEELAEELGVEPTEQYRTEVSTHRAQVGELDEEAAAAWLEMESAQSYFRDVLTTIGEMEADAGGDAEGDAEVDPTAAGAETLLRWLIEGPEGIGEEGGEPPVTSINPRYGWRFVEPEDEGEQTSPIVSTDTDLSYASSELAKSAFPVDSPQGAVENPAYLEDLPDRMVCG